MCVIRENDLKAATDHSRTILTRILERFKSGSNGVAFAGILNSACESNSDGLSAGGSFHDILTGKVPLRGGVRLSAGPFIQKTADATWNCCADDAVVIFATTYPQIWIQLANAPCLAIVDMQNGWGYNSARASARDHAVTVVTRNKSFEESIQRCLTWFASL
jgi:hypothetical protein